MKWSQIHPNIMKCTKTWVYGPLVWIGCVRSEKFQLQIVAWTFALIAPVRHVLYRVQCVMKQYQMYPNITKHNKILVWGPMVCIRWVRSEKYRRDFLAWTFALIVPVRHIFDRVSCRNETVSNAPKHHETHRNMSLGFIYADRVRS